jgi:hypothetical protein
VNEAALMEWLQQHKPAVACSMAYCVTDDEVRKLLNHHTGLQIEPHEESESAFRRYLQAFEKAACSES